MSEVKNYILKKREQRTPITDTMPITKEGRNTKCKTNSF